MFIGREIKIHKCKEEILMSHTDDCSLQTKTIIPYNGTKNENGEDHTNSNDGHDGWCWLLVLVGSDDMTDGSDKDDDGSNGK